MQCLLYFFIIYLFKFDLISSHLYYPFASSHTPFNRHVRPANCNSIIDQRLQWLLSVNYPSPYDENLNCLITVNKHSIDVCKIELTFPDFNLEYSLNCLNDYFLLNNGIRLCGVLAPDTKYILEFPVNQNQLELNFVTNSYTNKNGFVAIFNQLNDSCEPLSTRQYHSKAIDGWNIPLNAGSINSIDRFDQTNFENCNQRFYSFEGNFKTPNYPTFYPTNKLCRYLFKRSSDQVCKIKFKLKTFDLNNYPSKHDKINCDNGDYLEIVNNANRLCSYKIQEDFIIDYKDKSNYLPLYFYSDSIGVSTGFDIDFEQLSNSCTGKDPLITTKCDAVFKDENRLTSPNYPNYYEPNQLCVYEIAPINSTFCGFTLLFRHLSLELSVDQLGRCNKDYLELPNNERICGTSKPLEKIFEFNPEHRQYLVFASDNQNESDGFDIQIKQIPCQTLINDRINDKSINNKAFNGFQSTVQSNQCDQLITDRHQIIATSNYPHHNYQTNSNCQYSIYKFKENVCQLRLQFIDFDLETSNQCQNDYFEIMNTGERFCGRQLQSAIKILDFHNADAIRLRFISDSNQYTGMGFKIMVDQMENSCRNPKTFDHFNTDLNSIQPSGSFLKVCGIFNQAQFNIESPNYPLTYAPNINCIYRICKANPTVHTLDIFFNDFTVGTLENNFCTNDYLEINGERYCGYLKNQRMLINFPPNINVLNFRFRSNEKDNQLGFKLIIKQISSINQTIIGSNNFNILGLNTTSGNYDALNSYGNNGINGGIHDLKRLPQNDLYYFNQNMVNQFSSANDLNCLPKFFNQKHFYLTSPGYRNRNYPCSIQCNYWIKKASPSICAIQLTFDEFKIESSQSCSKDYLQVKNLKLCGQIPLQTKKTLEFSENQLVITFKTDSAKTDIGFHITIEQIEC